MGVRSMGGSCERCSRERGVMLRLLIWALLLVALVVPTGASAARHRVGVAEPADEAKWGFNPGALTIAVGDSVDFVNDGKVIHSFVANDNSFNSGIIQPGGGTF